MLEVLKGMMYIDVEGNKNVEVLCTSWRRHIDIGDDKGYAAGGWRYHW